MMIDFHTHILPNIDDGSRSVEESIQMLHCLQAQGVDVVVATPHYYADEQSPDAFFQKRDFALNVLKEAQGKDKQTTPTLSVGAEVAYYDSIAQMEMLSSFCIQNSSYLLLEMPFRPWSNHVLAEVKMICARGIIPIIAHVERYECFYQKKAMQQLLQTGAKIQLSCSVFQKRLDCFMAKQWLKRGYIHCLGSDCHNMTTRKPNVDQAMQKCKNVTFLQINS